MKKWKKLTAALLGLCIAATSAFGAAALERHPLDLNGDDTFDILDIIGVVKFLHGNKSNLHYWDAADMDKDGQVDIFDLGLLRHALIYGYDAFSQSPENARLLSGSYEAQSVKTTKMDYQTTIGQTQFAIDLLRLTAQGKEGTNVLVSPYSVSQALGMTANGAKGETRAEMESVLGGTMDTLNPALCWMRQKAPDNERAKLSTANSIWVRNGYPVLSEFLQTNANYYGADAFAAPFDDSTADEINHWVDEHTDHMIPSILDQAPDAATVMYLVNAVAFDAEWVDPYQGSWNEKFTCADGKTQKVPMMYGGDAYCYLEDDHATGFLKYYNGGEYAFAAILPEKGMTTEEYIAGLTPEHLYSMLAEPEEIKVITKMPQFSYEFDDSLKSQLIAMGMKSAFDPAADFSGMANGADGLSIDDVIHKTFIEVTELGTRAGAVTIVDMTECAVIETVPPKTVTLNRPFVYAIVDTQTNLPVFFGTVNSIE